MAKDLGGFMQKFAGSLGSQLGGGGMGGLSSMSPGGMILQKLIGGSDGKSHDVQDEPNPGQKMFGMNSDNSRKTGFLEKFGSSLSDQLFQKAMMGFMGR